MNPSAPLAAADLLAQSNPVWAWALAVTAVGLLVAALMVLLQSRDQKRGAVWAAVIFVVPIVGPAVYLVSETIRDRREHGRPEKGMVEKYAPEEVAQRREAARQEEEGRAGRRSGERDASAD